MAGAGKAARAETGTERAPNTRARILRVALEQFTARGYHATSVRELAERVGVTKAAVLYHFPGKADILAALAEPMLADLEAAVAAAELPDPAEARRVTIEGLLEVCLTHRHLLRLNLQDLALAALGSAFERSRDVMMRANALVAGPDPSFDDRVLAAQAVAMLADPVVLFADAPTGELRASVLRGVGRLLGDSGWSVFAERGSAPPGRRGDGTPRGRRGRPPVVDQAMAETARRMYDDGVAVAEIAATLGVSRATVYRRVAPRSPG